MKNKFTILTALLVLLTVGFGCSYVDQFRSGTNSSNTTTGTNSSNTATNSANPNETAKTGVAECDELIDILNRDQQNPDDNFVTRKIKEVAIDFAKEEIKRNIEQNQGDKTKIATGCREAKNEYLRSNQNNNSNPEQKSAPTSGNTQKL